MTNEPQGASYETEDESRFINRRRSNISSDLIEITEDKLENILLKYLRKLGSRKGWIAPLGLFISVVLANVSATFTDKLGIPASTWEAVFVIAAICSGIWLVVSIIMIIVSWKESSMTFLMSCIKDSEHE